jgi:hypothetical protein
MDIQNQLIEFANTHALKEKAFASIEEEMKICIESDNELGIDFLDGHEKSELIYEFGRFEFQLDKNDHCRFVTIINIYSKKLHGPNYNVPVGLTEEEIALVENSVS